MNKLIDFGRKAMFYVRVLSGYEERRIRSYRLQLEQRVKAAQKEKEALRKIPEQIILSEVRRMVEEMHNLNKQLEDTEAAINDYFKPLDKEAENIINMQLENEKQKMQMMGAAYKQAVLDKVEAESSAGISQAKTDQKETEKGPSEAQQAHMR